MRILITGGSGLIGRCLARELAARGDEVIVLSRDPKKVKGLPAGVRAAGWNGTSGDGWSDLLTAQSAIVHLAGEGVADGRWSEERKRRIRSSRLDSGKAVLEAVRAAKARPAVLLQGSAVGYYGDGGAATLTEESPPGTGFLADVCVEWERSTEEVEALGVRRAVLRTGIVLAGGGGALPKMALPFRLMVGGPLGSGEQVVPWIHELDEVSAIRCLLDRSEAKGPFNLTAPAPVTNRELSQAIRKALHRPSPMIKVPEFAIRLAVGEMAESVLQGQRAIPKRLQELGFQFRFPQIGPALDDLLG